MSGPARTSGQSISSVPEHVRRIRRKLAAEAATSGRGGCDLEARHSVTAHGCDNELPELQGRRCSESRSRSGARVHGTVR
eukprot:1508274-Rhodomonas_salina.7